MGANVEFEHTIWMAYGAIENITTEISRLSIACMVWGGTWRSCNGRAACIVLQSYELMNVRFPLTEFLLQYVLSTRLLNMALRSSPRANAGIISHNPYLSL